MVLSDTEYDPGMPWKTYKLVDERRNAINSYVTY